MICSHPLKSLSGVEMCSLRFATASPKLALPGRVRLRTVPSLTAVVGRCPHWRATYCNATQPQTIPHQHPLLLNLILSHRQFISPKMLFNSSLLAGLAFQAIAVIAQTVGDASSLKVTAKTSFPDSDILGLRLVNGAPTRAIIEVTNNEKAPVTVAIVAGVLANPELLPENTPAWQGILRNLSAVQYDAAVQPGEAKELSYAFSVDMLPRDVKLEIMTVITDAKGAVYQIPAYGSVTSVVDPATNLLDPQIIFLYLILSAGFAGALYLIFTTWIQPLFTQTPKREPRTPKKAKKAADLSTSRSIGAGTGRQTYDESWIPEHHINRAVSKKAAGKQSD
ncbi:hypothetical protein VHEMI10028 [[Torrubiella] hemipterigena]|uniref:Uncharacterized protein n=1 Tax=[Torrubiella] hemipterigena TaxID=1531966 RepID=A0A0A1THR7_9HYPO|nr:hypothetical protein VHEMI10028 [[Torrubiella] hemipterigena]